MNEHLKRCKKCGATKPLADYYRGGGGIFARCKVCCIEARKAAYRRDPEYTKNLVRRYRASAKALALSTTPNDNKDSQ